MSDHRFKGFMLQVVPIALATTSKRDITRGRFLPSENSELRSCYHNNDSVVQDSISDQQHLEVTWIVPEDFHEDVLVRYSFSGDTVLLLLTQICRMNYSTINL